MSCRSIMSVRGGRAQDPLAEARALAEGVRAYLEWLRETGVDELSIVEGRVARKEIRGPSASEMEGKAGRAVESEPSPTVGQRAHFMVRPKAFPISGDLFGEPRVEGARSLEELVEALEGCQRCKLAGGRTHIVFGVGNPRAQVMFVGEGPGEEEDLRGEPFVGRAGQLLTRIITNGMKLRREDVYIANIVKCRPEGNRAPQPDEIAACLPFLRRQIELIKPRVIVALGAVAVQALLGGQVSITRVRGSWQEYCGIPVMPTFHPAYLLRNPSQKQAVWEDIQEVMRAVGIAG